MDPNGSMKESNSTQTMSHNIDTTLIIDNNAQKQEPKPSHAILSTSPKSLRKRSKASKMREFGINYSNNNNLISMLPNTQSN